MSNAEAGRAVIDDLSSTPRKQKTESVPRDRGDRRLARFEVLVPEQDRALISAVVKHLAANDAVAAQLRADFGRTVQADASPPGGILAALRRSPLVGADLDLARAVLSGRDADL